MLRSSRPCFVASSSSSPMTRRERAVDPMLLPQAEREARARHQEDQHDRVEEQHAARNDRVEPQHDEHERNHDGAEARRADDPLQVRQACEAPEAPIQAERQEDRRLQRQDPRERRPHVGEERLAQVEVEAQPVDADPRDGGHADVVDESEGGAPVKPVGHRGEGMPVFLRQ
jgi:hypothetical protein